MKCMLSLVTINYDGKIQKFSDKVLNLSESSIVKVTKKQNIQIIL